MIKKNRKCAVLLAAYNGEKWIETQIESILLQSSVQIFLFINIDVSEDKTLDICKKLVKKNKNIRIISKNNKFGSPGSNFLNLIKSIPNKNFDYICLADQDDIWDSDKLITSIKTLETLNVQAYSSSVRAWWPNQNERIIKIDQNFRRFDYLFQSAGPGCTFVLNNQVFVKLQQFLTKHEKEIYKIVLHDWLIYAFCRYKKYKWFIDSVPKMRYRQHDKNVIGANVGIKHKLKRIRWFMSGWFLDQALLIYRLNSGNNFYSDYSLIKIFLNIFEFRRSRFESILIATTLLINAFKKKIK